MFWFVFIWFFFFLFGSVLVFFLFDYIEFFIFFFSFLFDYFFLFDPFLGKYCSNDLYDIFSRCVEFLYWIGLESCLSVGGSVYYGIDWIYTDEYLVVMPLDVVYYCYYGVLYSEIFPDFVVCVFFFAQSSLLYGGWLVYFVFLWWLVMSPVFVLFSLYPDVFFGRASEELALEPGALFVPPEFEDEEEFLEEDSEEVEDYSSIAVADGLVYKMLQNRYENSEVSDEANDSAEKRVREKIEVLRFLLGFKDVSILDSLNFSPSNYYFEDMDVDEVTYEDILCLFESDFNINPFMAGVVMDVCLSYFYMPRVFSVVWNVWDSVLENVLIRDILRYRSVGLGKDSLFEFEPEWGNVSVGQVFFNNLIWFWRWGRLNFSVFAYFEVVFYFIGWCFIVLIVYFPVAFVFSFGLRSEVLNVVLYNPIICFFFWLFICMVLYLFFFLRFWFFLIFLRLICIVLFKVFYVFFFWFWVYLVGISSFTSNFIIVGKISVSVNCFGAFVNLVCLGDQILCNVRFLEFMYFWNVYMFSVIYSCFVSLDVKRLLWFMVGFVGLSLENFVFFSFCRVPLELNLYGKLIYFEKYRNGIYYDSRRMFDGFPDFCRYFYFYDSFNDYFGLNNSCFFLNEDLVFIIFFRDFCLNS